MNGFCCFHTDLSFDLGSSFVTSFGEVIEVHTDQYYEGPYEVTPSREEQVLTTAALVMHEDVVVNPIPPEYGLVEWNGITMRIS